VKHSIIRPRRVSLAGFLASGFTILGGLVISLVVVLVFADSPGSYMALVLATFAAILLIPVRALQTPKDPAEKKLRARRWRWRLWRRPQRPAQMRRYWKRKPGQQEHRPFGTPDVDTPCPSTFVAAPRKPTGP
jgi:hypothetical protein